MNFPPQFSDWVKEEINLSLDPTYAAELRIGSAVGDTFFANAIAALDDDFADAAAAVLERTLDIFNQKGGGPALHNGIGGLALAIALYSPDEEVLSQIDSALVRQKDRLAVPGLRFGASGVAIFAARRGGTASGQELQNAIVDVLKNSSVRSGGGIRWHPSEEFLALIYRGSTPPPTPRPFFLAGMCYGQAGVIAGLTALARAGNSEAMTLLEDGLKGLASATFDEIRGFRFAPGRQEDDRWCSGSFGATIAAFLGARTTGNSKISTKMYEILFDMASRVVTKHELPGTPGSMNMCCGCAPMAHAFVRLGPLVHEPRFAQAGEILFRGFEQNLVAFENHDLQYGRKGALLALLTHRMHGDARWAEIFGLGGELAD